MARTQLKAVCDKSKNLVSKMKDAKNLPAWVQSKIAVAKDGITAVDDYISHSDEKQLDEAKKKKILVTLINDPRAKRGGGVMSIPKDQYDPKKHNLASEETIAEKWSKKYKDSINCSNPKGFSQKAHCDGKKKNLDERELTRGEKIEKEKEVMKLKPHLKGFTKRYGKKRGESIMYGVATNRAKELAEDAGTTTAQKKLRVQHKTVVGKAIGMERDPETIVVKRRGVPGSKTVRISKDRFDPTKYVKA